MENPGTFLIKEAILPFLKNWKSEIEKKRMIPTVDLLIEELEQTYEKN